MNAVAARPRSTAGALRAAGGASGFTLIEMMVATAIVMLLVGVTVGAAAAARGGQKRFKTAADIAKLDAVIQQHFTWCQSLRLPGTGSRADLVARRISGDMPDNWTDVATLASALNSPDTRRLLSGPQLTYAGIWRTFGTKPTAEVADAECLYMIVIRGGLADCLACSELEGIGVGDTDKDGAMEFLDAWGNPIRFVLWPKSFELPLGTPFFPGGTRTRPLIFSHGPDGMGTTKINDGSNLPSVAGGVGGFDGSATDRRLDNITNFDAEAQR